MPELGGALVITQPCPSTNSWGRRGPERSESCGAHTAFSGKARMPSNNQPGTNAGRRVQPEATTCCTQHPALHPVDAGGCCSQTATGRGWEALPAERQQEAPAGAAPWPEPHTRGSHPTQRARGPESDSTHLPPGEVRGLISARDVKTQVQGQEKALD